MLTVRRPKPPTHLNNLKKLTLTICGGVGVPRPHWVPRAGNRARGYSNVKVSFMQLLPASLAGLPSAPAARPPFLLFPTFSCMLSLLCGSLLSKRKPRKTYFNKYVFLGFLFPFLIPLPWSFATSRLKTVTPALGLPPAPVGWARCARHGLLGGLRAGIKSGGGRLAPSPPATACRRHAPSLPASIEGLCGWLVGFFRAELYKK